MWLNHLSFKKMRNWLSLPLCKTLHQPPCLNLWHLQQMKKLEKIIVAFKTTSCTLDPIRTSFMKMLLVPILTQIIHMSFEQGVMPPDLKEAFIIPLLKRFGSNPEILKNFRPLSKLLYLSKLIKWVSAKRPLEHMDLHLSSSIFPICLQEIPQYRDSSA